MKLEDFIEKSESVIYNHAWKAINSKYVYINYICNKCDAMSYLAYTGPSCISDDEAIIKKLLE